MSAFRKTLIATAISASSILGLGASAQAATLAGGFNAFVFGDFNAPSSDVEGAVAVGNNMTVSSYTVGLLHNTGGPALVVGNNLTYLGGSVHNGPIVVGGTFTGPSLGVTVTDNVSPLPVDFGAQQASLTALSAQLAGMSATGVDVVQWSSLNLTGDGSSPFQVFNIDGNDVFAVSEINLLTASLPADATIILNISGVSGRLQGGLNGFESVRQKVIFNFYEATDLVIGSVAVQGSILAPYASVPHNYGVVWGQVIVNNWNSSVQVNNILFDGDLPPPPEDEVNTPGGDPDPVASPEPASAAMLGLGLVGFAFASRRRR